jgi:hypothetical protein
MQMAPDLVAAIVWANGDWGRIGGFTDIHHFCPAIRFANR